MFIYDGGEDPPERITDEAMRAAFATTGAAGAAAVAGMIAVAADLPGAQVQFFAGALAVGFAGVAIVLWWRFRIGVTALDGASQKKANTAPEGDD